MLVLNDRYWITRHYVCISTLITFTIAWLSPQSLNARALASAGSPETGLLFIAALSAISLLGLAESAFAHWCARFRACWLRRQRHTIFMAIAVGQVCTAYIVATYAPESSALVLRFMFDAAAAALLAFLDLFSRHKADRC